MLAVCTSLTPFLSYRTHAKSVDDVLSDTASSTLTCDAVCQQTQLDLAELETLETCQDATASVADQMDACTPLGQNPHFSNFANFIARVNLASGIHLKDATVLFSKINKAINAQSAFDARLKAYIETNIFSDGSTDISIRNAQIAQNACGNLAQDILNIDPNNPAETPLTIATTTEFLVPSSESRGISMVKLPQGTPIASHTADLIAACDLRHLVALKETATNALTIIDDENENLTN